ncbi:MAG: SGNH/GDSL hydrolase family protein [Armatimonadota bacterium]
MRTRVYAAILSAVALSCVFPSHTAPEPLEPIEDDPDLPRVLLIGDSISIGYTLPVRSLLDGVANVHRIPVNGGPTSRGVAHIEEWLGDGDWDVIHFNFGLHDLKMDEEGNHQVPPEQYRKNLEKLVTRLEATGAELVCATTTPVPQNVGGPARSPADVLVYNRIAKDIMRRHNIRVNDLYSFAWVRLESIQRPRNVHFTEKGSAVLGEQVAYSIRKALGINAARPSEHAQVTDGHQQSDT